MSTAQTRAPAAELALQLIQFRGAHWADWSCKENELVVDCFHALREASGDAAQRQCTTPSACRWPRCSCEVAKPAAAAQPDPLPADGFNGDTPHLINCMRALVNLDEAGAVKPRIGGHARTLLLVAAGRLERAGGAPAGAPGASDAERAAWLADKIGAGGDYAKEAADMLRRWPAAAAPAIGGRQCEYALGACARPECASRCQAKAAADGAQEDQRG